MFTKVKYTTEEGGIFKTYETNVSLEMIKNIIVMHKHVTFTPVNKSYSVLNLASYKGFPDESFHSIIIDNLRWDCSNKVWEYLDSTENQSVERLSLRERVEKLENKIKEYENRRSSI